MKKLAIAALALGAVLTPLAAARPASAMVYASCVTGGRTLHIQSSRTVFVDARSHGVPVADVHPGQAVSIYYNSGSMWSGVWFTGQNGPEGWTGWAAPNNGTWAAPGANQYSLVSQFMPWTGGIRAWNDPAFSYVGFGRACVPVPTWSVLDLAVNDQRFDDNTGGFSVDVFVWG